MSKFTLAPLGKADIAEIWSYYVAQIEDVDLADRIRDEIFDGIKAAAKRPKSGHLRRDLATEPLRFWRVRRYLIVYRSEMRPIQIVRVLHGARDVLAILGEV